MKWPIRKKHTNAFSCRQWISLITITRIGSICVLTHWISLTNSSIFTFIDISCTGRSFPPIFACAVAWNFLTYVSVFSLASTVWGTVVSIFSIFTVYKLKNESSYKCKRWCLWVKINIFKACICCDMSCFLDYCLTGFLVIANLIVINLQNGSVKINADFSLGSWILYLSIWL